jgi:hypothetical protein
MFYRWQILEQVAKGEMPRGMTEADLRAMELPVPGEIEMVEEPDGQIIIRKVVKPEADAPRPAQPAASAFVCDSPDGE